MSTTLLRIEELAAVLKVKVATLRRWTYSRRIPCVRVGRRAVRYRLRNVERALLREQPTRAEGAA